MKYRKKPVVIEAIQFAGNNSSEIMLFANTACINKVGALIISTLEGPMLVSKGDFVIKGVNGEFYPCKPDIFEKTYEEVVDTSKPFVFDVESMIRRNLPDVLMMTKGFTEEEAKLETENVIKSNKDKTNFCKKELENIKCDFTGKVNESIKESNGMLRAPFITKTINAIWSPKQGLTMSFNIIETIENKYGPIPGETTKDKVDWIRDNVTIK
jgi:hypothetical protein